MKSQPIMMEYLEQGSLDAYIESQKSIELEKCLQLFEDIATVWCMPANPSLRSETANIRWTKRVIPVWRILDNPASARTSLRRWALCSIWHPNKQT